jgi:Lon protease-like protein
MMYALSVSMHVVKKDWGPSIHELLCCYPRSGLFGQIRQLRQLANGSMNVVAKGRQRFRVCNAWTQADGVVLTTL